MISPAGFVYLLLIVFFLLCQKLSLRNLFLLCLVTETFLRMGYIIKIGDSSISFELFIEFVFIFFCFFRMRNLSLKFLDSWLLLSISYILPLFFLLIFPSDILTATPAVTWDEIMFEGKSPVRPSVAFNNIFVTIKMLLFSMTYLLIYKTWSRSDYFWIINKFAHVSNYFLWLGVLECFLKNLLDLSEKWGDLMILFWGKSDDTSFYALQRGTYSLNLFTLEPAHYAYVLYFVAIMHMANNVIMKRNNIINGSVLIAIALMILSTSFSAVYIILAFSLIFLMHRWLVERPKYMRFEKILLFMCIFLLLSSFAVIINLETDGASIMGRLINMYDHIDEFVSIDWSYGDVMGDHSTQVRIGSMIQTVIAFCKRPIFGYSLMAIDAHSPTAMFVSGVGILGLYCWIKFFFFIAPIKKELSPNYKAYYWAIFIYLFVNLLGGGALRAFFGPMLFMMLTSYCVLFSNQFNMTK